MEIFTTRKEERDNAKEFLKSIGAIKYIRDMNIYHGREDDGSNWEVKTKFNNAGNATQNHNVSAFSGIYTADRETAKMFAKARAEHTHQGVIYKILPLKPKVAIYNANFDKTTLSSEDRIKYVQALKTLTNFPITKDKPIQFEYREIYKEIFDTFSNYTQEHKFKYRMDREYTQGLLDELYKIPTLPRYFKTKTNFEAFVNDMVSTKNTKLAIINIPGEVICSYVQGRKNILIDGKRCRLNNDYIKMWCKNNEISGFEYPVDSATLGRKINVYQLFDTARIRTAQGQRQNINKMQQDNAELSELFDGALPKDVENFIYNADGEELLSALCKDKGCNDLYSLDAGIWEKWTVGQHTQSVVDFFDRYQNVDFYDDLKPMMKVILLAHDIGKGVSRQTGVSQQIANKMYSHILYNNIGLKEEYRPLVDFVINDSQQYTTSIMLGKESEKQIKDKLLANACKSALTQIEKNGKIISNEEINALKRMCYELQRCDSGAYTYFADIKEKDLYTTGGNQEFTNSFELDEEDTPQIKKFKEFLQ